MIVRKTICQSEEKVTSSFVLILIVLNFIKNKYLLIIKQSKLCIKYVLATFLNYFIKIAIYTHYKLQHLFITLLRLKIITSYQSSTLPVDINQALFGKKVEIHDKIHKDNFQKFTEEKYCLGAKTRKKALKLVLIQRKHGS